MSISGVPPFNGFASKWMIYQGIIESGTGTGIASKLWILWLGLAVLGSALTLASFVKFIGGVFLGRKDPAMAGTREVPFLMWLPMALLAVICICFGVFATGTVIPKSLTPRCGTFCITVLELVNGPLLLVLVSIISFLIYLAMVRSESGPWKFHRRGKDRKAGAVLTKPSSTNIIEFLLYHAITGGRSKGL
jgi:NADH:ubiquinone oxidoreductase subunit 5 (subunit L)/multisubunit Na+/H+ antiporter MnhA subunit